MPRRYIDQQGLLAHLANFPQIVNCRCNASGVLVCEELDKISWNKLGYSYVHFRFDGCICSSSRVNKCDCIIFRFKNDEKPVMFAIETKKKKPKFTLAKRQLEYCVETMINALPDPKSQFAVTPIICGKKIGASLNDHALSNKMVIFGKPSMIRLRKYGQDINDAP